MSAVSSKLTGVSVAANPPTTASVSAATAAIAASTIDRLSSNTLNATDRNPKNDKKLVINSCLKQLAPLFGDPSVMEKLKYLPLEDIIDITIRKLYLTVSNLGKDCDMTADFHSIITRIIADWKNTPEINNIKNIFVKITVATGGNSEWQRKCEQYSDAILQLTKLRESHKTILKSPMDNQTRQALVGLHAEIMYKVSQSFLYACKGFLRHFPENLNKIFATFAFNTNDPSMQNAAMFTRPRQRKLDVLKLIQKQIDYYVFGQRFEEFHVFILNPPSATTLQTISQFKRPAIQMCTGIIKLSKDLSDQYLQTEKMIALINRQTHSATTKKFLFDYHTEIDKLHALFFQQLIQRISTLTFNWDFLRGDTLESTQKNLAAVFYILRFEIEIYRTNFQGSNCCPNKDWESTIKVDQSKIEQTVEALQKICKGDVRTLITQLRKEINEQFLFLQRGCLEVEERYFCVDKLITADIPRKYCSQGIDFVIVLRHMYDAFEDVEKALSNNKETILIDNETGKPVSSAKSDPIQIFQSIENCMRAIVTNRTSQITMENIEEVIGVFRDVAYKIVVFDGESKARWESSQKNLQNFSEVLIASTHSLSSISSCMKLIHDSFMKLYLLSQQEADAKAEELNAHELEWLRRDDEEVDDLPASATTPAIASEKKSKPSKSKLSRKSKLKKSAKQSASNTVVQSAANVASQPTAKKAIADQPVNYDCYQTLTGKLLAMHRHNVRRYYEVPEYIVTPESLLDKPYNSAEVAVQQQIMSTDCLQWVTRMLEMSKDSKVKELLTTYYFWWLHLGTEQGLTGKALKIDANSQLKHRIDRLCREVGLKASRHILKGHIWGTEYIRYPFTVPKPSKKPPIVFEHVREPSETTVGAVMAATEPMMSEFVQIQDSLLSKEEEADSPKSGLTAAAKPKTSEIDLKKMAESLKSPSSATASAAASASEQVSKSEESMLTALGSKLELVSKRLSTYSKPLPENVYRAWLKKAVLKNAQFHLDNLQTLTKLMAELPEQENWFVQMAIAHISTQYFCENLGHFLALQLGVNVSPHDLEFYTKNFKMGQGEPEVIREILKINLKKGSEYLFRQNHKPEVRELVRYLSGLFATSKYSLLTKEGISLPKSAAVELSKMRDEMCKKVEGLVNLVVKLVEMHIPIQLYLQSWRPVSSK